MRDTGTWPPTISRGAHRPGDRISVMEAVAWAAEEPWSQRPRSASPVVAAWMTAWADILDDATRQELRRFLGVLHDSHGTTDQEVTRQWYVFDWLVRHAAVTWLRAARLLTQADQLANLTPLATPRTLSDARPIIAAVAARSRDVRNAQGHAMARAIEECGDGPTGEPSEAPDASPLLATVQDATRAAILATRTLVYPAACAAGTHPAAPEPPPVWQAAVQVINDAAVTVARGAVATATTTDTWPWRAPLTDIWQITFDTARSALQPIEARVNLSAHTLVERMLALTAPGEPR